MKELEKYLMDYFNDWDLSEKEKNSLSEICRQSASQVSPLYELMKKMVESDEFRESIIDTIDETLTEQKDDNKTDT